MSTLIKNKQIETVFKKNQNKLNENELENYLTKFNFSKIMTKIGLVFIVAPTIYYFFNQLNHPLFSKELTDSYNTSLNLIIMSNSLYVKYFIN